MFLIPEKENPSSLSQPIGIYSLLKFFTKILAKRICPVLPKIISSQQSASITDREISENINLAQEIIRGIDRKNRGGNVVFKFVIEKVYDRLE